MCSSPRCKKRLGHSLEIFVHSQRNRIFAEDPLCSCEDDRSELFAGLLYKVPAELAQLRRVRVEAEQLVVQPQGILHINSSSPGNAANEELLTACSSAPENPANGQLFAARMRSPLP